ncbi:MAG: helix-turn-helix domain-containing protein [Chloroflexota bacterium]|nr:helix-turn-helix domain-containing protein [Chloroflexota bacterium]
MSTIHVDLPVLRARRRLSQRQLAALAGVRPDTISALERGSTAGIQFETLARLCEALHCTPGDILLFEGDDDHEAPMLGGPDEDGIIVQRIAALDRAPRVDGPSFLAALMERAKGETAGGVR